MDEFKLPEGQGAPTPTPRFKISNENVVVHNGGSAQGVTIPVRRKIGRDTVTVMEQLGTGNAVLQTHHAIHHDENGHEHIVVNGKYVKLSHTNLKVIRRETVKRG